MLSCLNLIQCFNFSSVSNRYGAFSLTNSSIWSSLSDPPNMAASNKAAVLRYGSMSEDGLRSS